MSVPQNKRRANDEDRVVKQTDLYGLIGYNIKRSYMHIHKDFKATLDEFNLTQRTFSVLSVVIENPNISQSDVGRALAIERSGTVVIVDELEQRDLISRDKAPGDRRVHALNATDKGRAFYAKTLEAVYGHEKRVSKRLSKEERLTLISLLEKIQGEEI
ncbi:MarR family winged helix-turn-helix transcriptional regulator [Actibacterium lipolyticum]|uniref:Transcriptional regulator SlyA n=1 Tax=Actibacterium lipolyticum TaxID=1524263 RepID=A0A238JNG7_9RHOB|nr:MarR family transcriptional regulator [Actibacterium lipolyticum]SMX32210.1 Transcriptional regulator SlyA [Actibacterium lipolyticum]